MKKFIVFLAVFVLVMASVSVLAAGTKDDDAASKGEDAKIMVATIT